MINVIYALEPDYRRRRQCLRKQRIREDVRAAVPECGTGADDSLADRAALHEALDDIAAEITPIDPPVELAMRLGGKKRHRRRIAAITGTLAPSPCPA